MKRDYTAIIKIYDLPTITSYRKSKLCNWLRETAKAIEDEEKQEEFNKIYTLRLMK